MRLLLALTVLWLAPAAAEPLFAPPVADFHWSPMALRAGDVATFVSTGYSPASMLLLYQWEFPEEETETRVLDGSTQRAFPRAGSYVVTHHVMDATGGRASVTRIVTVYNTPPVPRIILPDEPVLRGQTVQLHGSATDADGDAIVDWTWELGDGTVAYGATASRAYHELGAYLVTLWARDSEGEVGVDTAELRVVNRPPLVVGSFAPSSPAVGETVVFSASGTDPDVPNGRVAFEWAFSDGARFDGPMVERAFASPGEHTVTLVGIDADGGASEPYVLLVRVGP